MRAFVAIAASALILFSGQAFAKPAGCPCNPCKCGACNCGGGGGGGKKGDKHHHHDKDHARVGVGVNVDLGTVGHRSREADPFAVSGGEPATPHTQEKHKPKTKEREGTTTNPFNDVKLTGKEAKDESIPPSTVNVSNDNEEPSKDGAASGDNGKTIGTIDNLKQASDAYLKARKKALDADPKYQAALKIWIDNASAHQGSTGEKAFQKAGAKMTKIKHAFAQSDEGKKLYDDWVQAHDNAVKNGQKITDKDLIPSEDEIAQKKFDVAQAQDKVNLEQATYDAWKNATIAENAGVKNTQAAIDALKNKTHFSDKDAQADRDKVKQLEGDLENSKKQIAKDFASSKSGIEQAKNIQHAEQELGKAKEAFKPYEQLQEKPKAASNP